LGYADASSVGGKALEVRGWEGFICPRWMKVQAALAIPLQAPAIPEVQATVEVTAAILEDPAVAPADQMAPAVPVVRVEVPADPVVRVEVPAVAPEVPVDPAQVRVQDPVPFAAW
jgi:hypothetical protein